MKFQMELISNYICHGKHKDIIYAVWLLKILSFLITDIIQNLVKCQLRISLLALRFKKNIMIKHWSMLHMYSLFTRGRKNPNFKIHITDI